MVGLGLVSGLTSPASAQKTSKKALAVKCDGASGWAALTGVPAGLNRGAPLGLYVWNYRGAWRVTATGPGRKQRVFQGTLAFDAPVTAKPVGVEGRSDVVVVGTSSVAFTFKNFGQLDGISVEAPCSTSVTLSATIDGVALTPTQVFLGAGGTAPTAVPVVLRKEVVPPAVLQSDPAATSACPSTAWAENTTGRPPWRKVKTRALHVWVEKGVWQIQATGENGRPATIEGRITFNAPVTVKGSGLEGSDELRVDPRFDGSSVVFSFRSGRLTDGFTVASPCASQVTIDAMIDGVPIPTAALLIGPDSAPATAVPFVMSR